MYSTTPVVVITAATTTATLALGLTVHPLVLLPVIPEEAAAAVAVMQV
jgi:hypothetical protein